MRPGWFQRLNPLYVGAALGLAVAALFGIGHVTNLLRPIEQVAYDARFRLLARPSLASQDVVIIAFDNASFENPTMLENFGRWPWNRKLYAQLLWYLRQAPARAVGLDFTFAGHDADSGADRLFQQMLAEKKDTVLAFSMNDSRTEWSQGGQPKYAAMEQSAWHLDNPGCGATHAYTGLEISLPELNEAARTLGVISLDPDSDGLVRRMPLFFNYGGRYYPALSVALAEPSLQGQRGADGRLAARFDCAGAVALGRSRIPLDRTTSTAAIYWYGDYDKVFAHYPVWQVFDSAAALNEQQPPAIPLSTFRDKIVLVGATASGIADLRPTPFSPVYPGVDVHATVVSNLLQGHFVRPAHTFWSLVLIAILAVAASLIVWYFNSWHTQAAVTAVLAAAFLAFNFGLFWQWRVSVLTAAPLMALATSFAGASVGRYITEGREKKRYRSTLVKYVAPTIVEAMMQDSRLSELHNEKRELTVLFSDVRGFTTLSEKTPVDQLVRTLNEFLNAMVSVIFANGGTLDKFVGDCVMAFWGAPFPQANHAELATRTALDMQDALERLNEKWRAEGRPELKTGVGINTGEMIFGNIGSQQRMDFTVIGDNVNLAARLESSTKELKATIVISDSTYQQIKDLAEVRDLGSIHVKGKDVPIRVYELLSMRQKEKLPYATAKQ